MEINNSRFWATFEPTTTTEGIVTLSLNGKWAGSGLVQIRKASASMLREEAYRLASLNAQAKGGTLDRFTVA
jgi:hypothetical protein